MQVWALSDPHFGRDMSRFGEVWKDHETRIYENWRQTIAEQDLVLIPGDFSWGTTTKTVDRHLKALDELPGRLIISPGNHDRWWKKTERLSYDSITFLADAHEELNSEWMIAATMGWDTKDSPWWREEWQSDLDRAIENLQATLAAATAARDEHKILLMIHYPPRWNVDATPSVFEEIIAEYPVELVLYGHIHGVDLPMAHNGEFSIGDKSIRYENASCDRLEMQPLKLLEFESDLEIEGSC